MARAKEVPIPNTPARAQAALDADLPLALRGRAFEETGWSRPDPLTLLIPLVAVREDGTHDDYLLKLNFLYYDDWPPSAQFVNRETHTYRFADDVRWLPKIEGTNEIAVHPQYDLPAGAGKTQLICASVTLEFYQVLHSVEARLVWDPKVQTFAATLAAIERVLRKPFYKGRQA
jgi:hypothetical protein